MQCVAQQNSGDCEIWFAVSKMQNADFNRALADSPRLAQESDCYRVRRILVAIMKSGQAA